MAWRPMKHLLEGELDNTVPGRVTGWMQFAAIGKVRFDLKGDFHHDIRGVKIRFKGNGSEDNAEAASYMHGFALHQTGHVGDITAGLPPTDYAGYPYIEWYGDENGRVVLELEAEQIEVIGQLLPWKQWKRDSREQQAEHMTEFLGQIAQSMNIPKQNALCVSIRHPDKERSR